MVQALIASLRSQSAGMTPALSRVAATVLSRPDVVLYQSITELAEASGSSEASVMRFCREQGFSGFQDFKLALAKELAADDRLKNAQKPTDDIQQLVETAVTALRETEQLIVRANIAGAAEKILAARVVDCFGSGASAVTAQYLAYKIARIGLTSRSVADAHLATMAASTTSRDVVHVIISSSGSTVDAVQVARQARAQGAFVLGISNRAKSPLTAACDLTLIASWPETPLTGGAFPSKISQLLIVDALVVEMMRRDPQRLGMIQRTAESVSDRSF